MIISGEHAVLDGFPVVCLGINQRIVVKIKQKPDGDKSVFVNSDKFGQCDFGLSTTKRVKNWCEGIFFLCKKLSKTGLEIDIKSDILDWGFGSSGAIFSCVCCGLLLLMDKSLTKTELLKKTLALYFEYTGKKKIKSSGVDVITSVLGGAVYYNKSKNIISKLSAEFFDKTNIEAVYTGHKTQTAKTIEVVEKNNHYKDVFYKIGKITNKIVLSVLHNKKSDFYNLIKENQEQLTKLGLVDKDTQNILDLCKKQNFPAKISGSGLGDCVVVFGKNGDFGNYKSIEIKPELKGLEFVFND